MSLSYFDEQTVRRIAKDESNEVGFVFTLVFIILYIFIIFIAFWAAKINNRLELLETDKQVQMNGENK